VGRFASAAYQAVQSLETFEQHRAALNLMEDAVHSAQGMEKLNAELRESEQRLATELNDMRQLQEVSTHLVHEGDGNGLYEQILEAATVIMQSEYASIQMLYPERGSGGELRLLAFRGFNPEAAKFWEWVRADSESTCGAALRTGKRVIARDVLNCEFMAGTDDLATYLQTGIHAVQTTPLVSRGGKTLGMISTHWHDPHQPSERDLHLLDILARQAADLSERNQAETALRKSEERFRTISNAAPVMMWIAGTDKLCTYFNEPWLDFTGRTMEQELGNGWVEGVYPEDRERCMQIYIKCFDNRQSFSMEYRLRRADGQYRWILDEGVPLVAPDGTFSGYVGGCFDITSRKETEAALLKSEKLAAAGRMAAAVAHEINNPLEAVTNLLYLLRSDVSGENGSRNLAMAEQELTRVAQITKRTLAFYRDTSIPGQVNLRAIIDRTLLIFADKITHKRILVVRADQPCTVQGLEGELQQLLSNLIANAIDAVAVGGRVEISVRQDGKEVIAAVRDNGSGIRKEHTPKLFEPFFSTKQKHMGTGLGLWISREVAQKHGAEITVESNTDALKHGTTFQVAFPATHPQTSIAGA
jgi:PAS domain S-box-containing protein